MLAGMLLWFALAAGEPAGAPAVSYQPLKLHQLIGLADRVFAGQIVAVNGSTVEVEVNSVGFGAEAGQTIRVAKFKDWTCAQRWAPYAVGQRCLYFLRGAEILSAGGEGEMPISAMDRLRLRAEPEASAALAGTAIAQRIELAAVGVALQPLLLECRRYREVFRFTPWKTHYWEAWIEPRVGEPALAAYRDSSPLAKHLLEMTFGDFRYRDPSAVSPRPPDPGRRFDLGIGPLPTAMVVLDLDGDGANEVVCARDNSLAVLWASPRADREEITWSPDQEWGSCEALASVGDLGHDGTQELAVADRQAHLVRIVSLDETGVIARKRLIGFDQAVFGNLNRSPYFGSAVAAMGDLDGDGTQELAIASGPGSPAYSPPDPSPGSCLWSASLDASGAVVRAQVLLDEREEDVGAFELAALGDLDGNGVGDLAVARGKPSSSRAAMVVLFLEADGAVARRSDIVEDGTGHVGGKRTLAPPGDWNGDGVPDLAVGSRTGAGRELRVLFLQRDGGISGSRVLPLPEDLREQSDWGVLLAASSRADGAARLWCAGYSWIEPRGKSRTFTLRRYPSVWRLE